MAFEAIKFDAGKFMAGCAEVLRVFIADNWLVCNFRVMTFDATGQAVFATTLTQSFD